MTIQQLSGIDTVVSNEKYNAYGTVKSRIANAYNRLPLEIQQLKFNEMLQNKLEDEINGIGGRRKKKPKAQRKEERKERRKEDKGLRALRLFMPLMRRKLKKKGVKITDPKSIKEVSTKFKTFIMDKKPINGFDDSDVIGVIPPGAGAAAGEAVEVSAGLIKKIIDFIKGAIKKIKDRKKKGGKVSAEEEEDIKEGEAVEKEVESGAGGGAGGGMALPLLAAGAAALFLLKK
jgi:phage-related tail protein